MFIVLNSSVVDFPNFQIFQEFSVGFWLNWLCAKGKKMPCAWHAKKMTFFEKKFDCQNFVIFVCAKYVTPCGWGGTQMT